MNAPWVCLMYHQVLQRAPAPGSGDYFAVSRQSFAADLGVVAASGRHGCSVSRALEAAGGPVVAITFDDGTAGHFEHALPELVARGFSATFFVTSRWVGRQGYVSASQLRAMADAGMEIGSHTRSHPFLSELGPDDLRAELAGSREDLEQLLGREVGALALPGGDAPRRGLRRLVLEAGYRVVATSRWGVNPPATSAKPVLVRRCTVRAGTEAPPLIRVIAGDPWLSLRRQAREGVLAAVRRALGPTRYASWRRRFLDASPAGGA